MSDRMPERVTLMRRIGADKPHIPDEGETMSWGNVGYAEYIRADIAEDMVDNAICDERLAAPRLSDACVEVKPLQWRNSYGVMRSETPFGDYIVTGKIWRIGSGMSGERVSDNPCEDAQADYEQRIRSALIVTPKTEKCAEVKPGYSVAAKHDYSETWVMLETALTTRTVEDVRREAFLQAAKKLERMAREKDGSNWFNDAAVAVIALIDTPAPSRETQPTPEPVVWITTDPDIADFNGFVDARINPEGEFTRPLYATPQPDELRQAKAEAYDIGYSDGALSTTSWPYKPKVNPYRKGTE